MNRDSYLKEAPSIGAALELLSDKEPVEQHGEWLPWLNGEIESGRLIVGIRQVQRYTKLASNTTRESFLPEATSIRAALELLSDKEPAEQQR